MVDPKADSEETRDLLESSRAGDSQAFEELFDHYRAFLHRVVELRMCNKVRARVDPSDVVQETQLEAFRRLDDYLARQPMPFRLWLHKTAQEKLWKIQRGHLETGRRAMDQEVPLPEGSSWALVRGLLNPDSTPSQQMEKSEAAKKVRQAIARLAEADREILLMRNFEGLTNQEVAQLLDLEPATASKRHGRALLRLREVLLDVGVTEL